MPAESNDQSSLSPSSARAHSFEQDQSTGSAYSSENQDPFYSSVPNSRNYLLDNLRPEDCTSVTEEARKSSYDKYPYVSFGDSGTTATISAQGDILQMCQSHESSRSGVFCVDPPQVPEPYLVQSRAEKLMSMRKSEQGSGNISAWQGGQTDFFFAERVSDTKLEFVHDRWPLFTDDYGYITLRILYVAFKGIIFQQYELSTTKKPLDYPIGLDLTTNTPVLIRDLDFVDSHHNFNRDEINSDNYTHCLYHDEKGFIIEHKGFHGQKEAENSRSVALAVAMFVNGTVQRLEINGDFTISRTKPPNEHFKVERSKSLQMTLAYKVLLPGETWNGPEFPINSSSLCAMHWMLRGTSFAPLSLSQDYHMDFIMRRNLEHILSVCSVPVHHANCEDENLQGPEQGIALTCGDMSGHRVITSASFFAFRFLLSMYTHLTTYAPHRDPQECSSEITKDSESTRKGKQATDLEERVALDLMQRIEKVCKGHSIWLTRADKDGTRFWVDYWVTGQAISSEHYTSTQTITDTPFQIIKLAEYTRMFKDTADDFFSTNLRGFVNLWIQKLDGANTRQFYAFPRTSIQSTESQAYRLDDHIWIWKALQLIDEGDLYTEREDLDAEGGPKSSSRAFFKQAAPTVRRTRRHPEFASATFKKHALRRFTTENPISKQRMLAVARSSSENRFYLHSRDTALFYEENAEFFLDYDTLWEATMDAQKLHDEFEESSQGNPLRCALTMMLGQTMCHRRHTETDDLWKSSKAMLIKSSSASGLFPGAQNPVTLEPEPIQGRMMRDAYWHRTFEVPYVLWQRIDYKSPQNGSSDVLSEATKPNSRISQATDSNAIRMEMQRWMPFNNVIVQKNIVEFSDEWLYKLPSFFHSGISSGNEVPPPKTTTTKVITINLPKASRSEKNHIDSLDITVLDTTSDLSRKLKGKRTIHDHKKRLVWIAAPTADTSAICCATSVGDETDMSRFFERYNAKSKYFSDEVTASANLWTTELHLSSYRISTDVEHVSANSEGKNARMMFLGSPDEFVTREGIGFRFVGDFFDRYWTCHVIDTGEITQDSLIALLHLEILDLHLDSRKRPWKQRKVLELLLLERMLGEVTKRYEGMIAATEKQLQHLLPRSMEPGDNGENKHTDIVSISRRLFSRQLDNDAYLRIRRTWPPFKYSLQVMEEDLEEILKKIDLWNRREADREPYQPRWTMKDERRYRIAISKLASLNRRQIQKLMDYLAIIRSLNYNLSSGLTSTRDDLNFSNAENIRYFTYLTAVFLPLGFATGIWSMSAETPRNETVKGMAITASVPLAIIIALMNLQKIHKMVRTALQNFCTPKQPDEALNQPRPKENSTSRQGTDVSVIESAQEPLPETSEGDEAGCWSSRRRRRKRAESTFGQPDLEG